MKHPALRSTVVAAFALLAGCGADHLETPVRTTTPSGSWTAPSAAQAAERDRALVRVVSAIPGDSRFDLFVEGQKIAESLDYRTITPFYEVPSGRQALRVRPAGLDTAEPMAEQTHTLSAGRHYTVVMMPGAEGEAAAAVRVFDDPMEVPEQGQAVLRILHAGADAGQVDVHVPGRQEPLAAGLDFQRASDFAAVAGSAEIELRPANRSETMHRVANLRPAAGGIYTIVVIGRTRIDPPLETLVIEDRIVRRPD